MAHRIPWVWKVRKTGDTWAIVSGPVGGPLDVIEGEHTDRRTAERRCDHFEEQDLKVGHIAAHRELD